MSYSQKSQREAAVRLVLASIDTASDELLRRYLCDAIGHPPIVESCFSEISCGRCERRVGDTLIGTLELKGKAVIGHDCKECRLVCRKLTMRERLLLPKKAVEFVTRMRQRAAKKAVTA